MNLCEVDLRAKPLEMALEPAGNEPIKAGLVGVGLDQAYQPIDGGLQGGAIA
ncbi:hypothetical protein [Halochromatium roseum]|uniref:hypothetical protein n=1 Tax=Halochromatium roseum TaxID=391920 RepID=UPI001912277B|nr:hypothetical protein [Halochromatium roseum]